MKKLSTYSKIIDDVYQDLAPYSKKYSVDKRRYAFTASLIENLSPTKGARILDIGTGIGILPYVLTRLGYQAEGADLFVFPEHENDMFQFAEIDVIQERWQAAGVTVTNTNIYKHELPWPNDTYDIVVSEAMIEHLKDPKTYLEQMKRLVKPGGHIIISTPNLTTLLKRVRFLLGRSPNWPIKEFFADGESFTGHWREYTMKELIEVCELAGLTVVTAHNINLLAKFKSWRAWKKNLQALFVKLSWLIPGSREMLYVVVQKST